MTTLEQCKVTAADASAMPLGPWSAAPDRDWEPDMREHTLWAQPGGGTVTGVWEVDPGTFRVDFGAAGEFLHLLSGELTCRGDDGDVVELRAGDVMTFPTGWSGEWTAHTRVRKVYCTFAPPA